jgi:hypothetical protein
MSSDAWHTVLEKTHDAVCEFARAELLALTRRAVHRLKRTKASGIYGEDYRYRSLWKEYCHEVQEGPYEALQSAWDDTLDTMLRELIQSAPKPTAMLLSILAASELEEQDDEATIVGTVWLDGIVQLLKDRLAEEAGGGTAIFLL